MKKLMTGLAALTLTTSAMAVDLSINPYVVAERAIEAEKNSATLGASTELVQGLAMTVELNAVDVDSNAEFAYSSTEVDFSYAVAEKVKLYVNNDFDADFNHAETVVGVKVSF